MKTALPVVPSDNSIERHVPGDADENDGQENRACDSEVPIMHTCCQAFKRIPIDAAIRLQYNPARKDCLSRDGRGDGCRLGQNGGPDMWGNATKIRIVERASAWRLVFVTLGWVILIGHAAHAQTTAGSINGQVTDSSGSAVPQAKITVTNKQTQEQRFVVTAGDGTYQVPLLPPGIYTVTTEAPAFRTAVAEDVRVLVNTSALVNVTLQVGNVSERVEVSAAAPLLQTTDSTIGAVIENEKVVQLPLNGRQFTQLVLLAPGAAYKETGQQSSFNIKLGSGGVSPSVNGQSSHHNNFTLDGLENNSRFDNTYAVAPPPDAIQEFKVQSHIADARFGLGAGANVNVATKSGTSEFHGSVWEFLRNDKLDARNFFDFEKRASSGELFAPTKPPFRQNQYGVAFGGPVMLPGYDGRKHNTFFFAYWEGFRSRKGFTRFASVPTAEELNGDFSKLLTS